MKRMRVIFAAVIAGALAWAATPARAQQTPQSLIYAVYDNETGAMDAYKSLQQAQREKVVRLESYAVVSKDANGKVHVQRSNQKKGTIAGAVVGGLIGSLGGPAGAAVGATAGGAMGRATGEAFGIPREDIKAIKDTLAPGSSALIAVVDERWVGDLSRSLQQTDARRILQTKVEQGTMGGAGQESPSGAPAQPSAPAQPTPPTSPGMQPNTAPPPPQP
jgi:uncharacterized membrane protein